MASFGDCCFSKKETMTSIRKSTLSDQGSSSEISLSCEKGSCQLVSKNHTAFKTISLYVNRVTHTGRKHERGEYTKKEYYSQMVL